MTEMNFDEFVQSRIRAFEQEAGPVTVTGEIDQFKTFSITVHGKKETLRYTGEQLEEYYMSYLDQNAGPNALRAVC